MAKGLWPVINVGSVEKSVEFYKGLGLKTRIEDAGMPDLPGVKYGTVDFGESGIIIWDKTAMPSDQPQDTRAWVSGELGKGVVFTIGVANAKRAWEKAQAMRANVDVPFETQSWGGSGFTVVDPDGFVVSITDRFPEMTPTRKPVRRAAKAVKRTARKVAKKAKGKRR